VELKELGQQIRRIDFLQALGVSIEPDGVAIACVSKRFLSVALRHFKRHPLPPLSELAERKRALAQAVSAFIDEFGIEPGCLYLSLPRQEIMVNRLLLPAAAKENLSQVLEYEIERVIPLERSQVCFDFQATDVGGGDAGRLSVLVLCVARDLLGAYLEALTEAGAMPKAVVASPVALGDCALFVRRASQAALAVVSTVGSEMEVALVSQGRLVGSHLIDRDGGRAREYLSQLLGGELVGEAGAQAEGKVELIADGPVPESWLGTSPGDLVSELCEQLEGARQWEPAESHSFVRAVGAALGAAREGQLNINLLPQEHRKSFREGLLPSIVLLAFSVLLLLAWGLSSVVRDGLTARQLRARVAELEPQVRSVEKEEAQGKKTAELLTTLTADQDRHVVDLLREMTELVPTSAYLTTFRYRNGRIEVDGFASSAADLIGTLENSPMFSGVTFTSPVTKAQDGRERFSLVAEVER